MNFCEWLKRCFDNFHELEYDSLVKLEECWWKVNTHLCSPFAYQETHVQGPYANSKLNTNYNPYLDINRIFSMNYSVRNNGDTQGKGQHEGSGHELINKPPVCKVRRFEMIKYSFGTKDEYIAVTEDEYDDPARTEVDACRAYQEIFRIMDEGWLVTKAKE
ncbi:hypothetical protein Tco_0780309 [Tanacetum coccineum]